MYDILNISQVYSKCEDADIGSYFHFQPAQRTPYGRSLKPFVILCLFYNCSCYQVSCALQLSNQGLQDHTCLNYNGHSVILFCYSRQQSRYRLSSASKTNFNCGNKSIKLHVLQVYVQPHSNLNYG